MPTKYNESTKHLIHFLLDFSEFICNPHGELNLPS